MVYKFSDIKEQEALVENELETLKKEYKKLKMPDKELEKLKEKMEEAKTDNKIRNIRVAIASAAAISIFMVLPNMSPVIANAMEHIPIIGQLVHVVVFRDYKYETDKNMADVEVTKIQAGKQDGNTKAQEKLGRTTAEINKEIQGITDKLIKEFEAGLNDKEEHQDITVKSEILATANDYFTLKLNCYQGTGSGYQWNYYYTINLDTGKRMELKDIFKEGTDYITPISENIKKQMKEQMEADKDIYYWLDDEVKEWNFKTITDKTSFYINKNGSLIICFNEGDVAPMYMGDIEFEIPADILKNIRK